MSQIHISRIISRVEGMKYSLKNQKAVPIYPGTNRWIPLTNNVSKQPSDEVTGFIPIINTLNMILTEAAVILIH